MAKTERVPLQVSTRGAAASGPTASAPVICGRTPTSPMPKCTAGAPEPSASPNITTDLSPISSACEQTLKTTVAALAAGPEAVLLVDPTSALVVFASERARRLGAPAPGQRLTAWTPPRQWAQLLKQFRVRCEALRTARADAGAAVQPHWGLVEARCGDSLVIVDGAVGALPPWLVLTLRRASSGFCGPSALPPAPPPVPLVPFVASTLPRARPASASVQAPPKSAVPPALPAPPAFPSRYQHEFEELGVLGTGGFGKVMRARNRLDGMEYAIKMVRLRGAVADFAPTAASTPAGGTTSPLSFAVGGSPLAAHAKALVEADQRLLREVKTFARMSDHPNIVRYYSAWIEAGVSTGPACDSDGSSSPASDTTESPLAERRSALLLIQMQLCPFQDLRKWLLRRGDRVDQWENLRIFRQIVEALQHCHAQNVVHRDVKPENIFVDADRVVLGDFGLATRLGARRHPLISPGSSGDASSPGSSDTGGALAAVGTATYAAPELLAQQDADDSTDSDPESCSPLVDPKATDPKKSDMYSLGVILFELFSPFQTGMERALVLTQLKTSFALPTNLVERYPAEASLLASLLARDPARRPSADEVLFHEVFQRLDDHDANAEVARLLAATALVPAPLIDRQNATPAAFGVRRRRASSIHAALVASGRITPEDSPPAPPRTRRPSVIAGEAFAVDFVQMADRPATSSEAVDLADDEATCYVRSTPHSGAPSPQDSFVAPAMLEPLPDGLFTVASPVVALSPLPRRRPARHARSRSEALSVTFGPRPRAAGELGAGDRTRFSSAGSPVRRPPSSPTVPLPPPPVSLSPVSLSPVRLERRQALRRALADATFEADQARIALERLEERRSRLLADLEGRLG